MAIKNKLEVIPFTETPQHRERLEEIISENKTVPGALVKVLKEAQELYGYLPLEVQITIAEGLDVPLEEVYGVVSFYSLFTVSPKGKYKASVCLGTACYVRGSGEIYESLQKKLGVEGGGTTADGLFSLEACRCVGACGLAPVMLIGEDVYGRLTEDQLDGILAKYRS